MEHFKIIEVLRKGRLLSPAHFGCLEGIPTINITNGCLFRCSYCYARGYSQTPKNKEVYLYKNIPDLLKHELLTARKIPDCVILNTSSDCFQSHPDILQVSQKTMEILLNHGISISFLTKGIIPDYFLSLFSRFPNQILIQIGVVSLSESYWKSYEPGTPPPKERLENIDRLKEIGIIPEVRIDPIIPFVTDKDSDIRLLFEKLREKGVKNVTLSYLHLRPAIERQLMKELPYLHQRLLDLCFKTQQWRPVGSSTKTKLIPRLLREKGYRRFKEIAKEFEINTSVCQCKNPDLEADLCGSGKAKTLQRKHYNCQLPLFRC